MSASLSSFHLENPNPDMILSERLSKLCVHDTFSGAAVAVSVTVH